MKNTVVLIVGAIGGIISSAFGGWNAALTTLLIAMCIDYISGLVVAAVFHKSEKSANGALDSRACWKGLIKKGMILLIVLIAFRLDLTIGTSYVRDAVCIAFIANEIISITENAALMGVPIPKTIVKAIDILKQKGEKEDK